MGRAGVRVSFAAVAIVWLGSIAAGCGGDGSTSEVDRSRVAKAYAMATVEEHDREKALGFSPSRESQIDFEIEQYRRQKMHVVGGPIKCPIDPFIVVQKPCFGFRLEGDPIPTKNAARGVVSFGTLSIGVSATGDPVVVKTGFMGGGRTVDIP